MKGMLPLGGRYLSPKRLTQILRRAIIAYESELDDQGYECEEELHKVLLNEFSMSEDEYQRISRSKRGGRRLSAYVHVIPDEEYEILQKYLDEGTVLVRKSVADEIKEKTGENPDGLYLDSYDFGGDADVWVDVVRNKDHMAYDAIIKEITGTECDFDDDDT